MNSDTVRCSYALNKHLDVMDGFIDLVREEQQRSRTHAEKVQPSSPPQYGINSSRSRLLINLPSKETGAGAIIMVKRKRDIQVLFWVSTEEQKLIRQKMQQYGTVSVYLRKMALDGYVVKLDLPELNELVYQMRRSSNNLNQAHRKSA